MTPEEKKALAEQIGAECAQKIAAHSQKVDDLAKQVAQQAEQTKGLINEDTFNAYKDAAGSLVNEVKEIARKQGEAIQLLQAGGATAAQKRLGVGEFLHKNAERLRAIKKGSGGAQKLEFMITADRNGQFFAQEVETKDDGSVTSKAAGPHATADGIAGGAGQAGNVSSIFQSMSASAILRAVADAPLNEQYRNSTWLFPVLGLEQVGMENRVAFYFDEEARQGSSANVPEGSAKPYVQYGARLRSADYRKRAVAMEFTDEFQFDFQFLQTYFLEKARIDLYNDINADVYTRVLAAGTAYAAGDATAFKTAFGGTVTGANNYDVLVAMAAKVNKNTFGANANAAIMSTEKSAAISITKNTTNDYLSRPGYIQNMAFVENPAIGVDDVIVGDFSQYKLQMRGGLIVRAGLNGNNLIENKMTYVMEQFYFDYISPLRQPAIVKGTTFNAVRTLLSA